MSSKHAQTWDQFLSPLLEKGYVSRASICRIKDGKRWSSSPGFDVSPSEIQAIASGFEDGGTKLRVDGLYVGSIRFTLTRVNNTIMEGRDSASGSGCVIYRCNKCFVIAAYDSPPSWKGCHAGVARLGDFLRYNGY